jgi:hypothetical protein
MKASGGMKPRSGWIQRTSASTPTICPLASSAFGWKWTTSCSCSIAARNSPASASRSASFVSCSAS